MKKDPSGKRSLRMLLALVILFAVIVVVAAVCVTLVRNMQTEYADKVKANIETFNEQEQQAYQERLNEFNAKKALEESQRAASGDGMPQPASEGWDLVDLSAFPLEGETTQAFTRAELESGDMVVINEWHEQPAGFDSSTLASIARRSKFSIPTRDNSVMLFPAAIDQIQSLLTDAKVIGLENYEVIVGYRDYEMQKTLWDTAYNANLKRYRAAVVEEMTRRATSYPGTSDHHSGYTFQLRLYSSTDPTVIKQDFLTSLQGMWFMENGWKYGFTFRYPQDKSYITGIHVDVNTFRYVGLANAAAMNILDLCLEEYVAYLQEHPHIAIYKDGIKVYEINRTVADSSEGWSVDVPLGTLETDVSSDNCGGIVATYIFSYQH
ncbi:MAG: D-alanyl-D-alanine carboxypeptidase family protein [Eubacteriales bacterium]|nr:D-alanyl-D-alanine carboxypeptidase family protein [Eubacteriales bacterium]MDD3881263.1 D-alanyl-D-alanine carboxypeptidase family protein [Eubacteriales bacterium]MDD4512181.1 D-alanyl-D-alanine carboxypeptidase family protein [Eubacteriales bacterium]